MQRSYNLTSLLCMLFISTHFIGLANPLPQKPINIIFDLGGVLLTLSKGALVKEIGFFNTLSLIFKRTTFMEALRPIPSFSEQHVCACDEQGKLLPPICCDWLRGVPSQLLLERLGEHLADSVYLDLCNIIFTPERFSALNQLNSDGAELVKECHAQGYNLYVLSNWPAESFEIIYKSNKEFFDLFDGIVISGSVNLIKPDQEIFDYIVKTYNLDPANTIFIDDQAENILAAALYGIDGIQCGKSGLFFTSPAINKVRDELRNWIACHEQTTNNLLTT